MKRSILSARPRSGAFAPLTVILLVPLVGMLAFAIDIGYIVTTQAELQNAADAAALAGAQQLQDLYNQYYLPQQSQQQSIFTTATTNTGLPTSPMYMAEKFAYYNQAANVYLQVPDSDVVLSYKSTGASSLPPSFPAVFPNTVTVTVRRDNVANTPLGLFFGQVFGVSQVSLTATASATIYTGDVTTLKVIPGVNAHILPVALDVNIWKNFFLTGLSPDGTIHAGPNGAPQLHIYPYPGNAPGSFGLLDVGLPAQNVPAFRNWIDNGTTPNDIQYLLTNNMLPVSPTNSQWWKCGPGLKSTLVTNFHDAMGQSNLIPLFIPVNDGSNGQPYVAAQAQGSSASYNVCGFAGVLITQADSSGTSLDISVQPAAIVDPTAVLTNLQPAGPPPTLAGVATQTNYFGTLQSTFVSAKLTQ